MLQAHPTSVERFEASRGATRQHLLNTLSEITQRLWDELGAKTILMISEVESKYFEDSQFPVVVFDKFPQVSFDATEAGKCLAMSRPTACVFHLMRVTEYGLHEIGKTLGMKEEKPNWEPIILKIDAELRKPYKEREHKGLRDFLANVSVHMNAVKVAWRNRVMHVDKKHTPEEAIEIYSATCGLMRYISENLPTPEKKTALSVIRGMIKG